jgi:hypothetical protein
VLHLCDTLCHHDKCIGLLIDKFLIMYDWLEIQDVKSHEVLSSIDSVALKVIKIVVHQEDMWHVWHRLWQMTIHRRKMWSPQIVNIQHLFADFVNQLGSCLIPLLLIPLGKHISDSCLSHDLTTILLDHLWGKAYQPKIGQRQASKMM